jgi:hypothetical protein
MTDVEVEFAERFAADVERILGAGIAVDDLELLSTDGRVRARASLLIEGRVVEIAAEAADLHGLYRPLMEEAAAARLRGAFWRIVGPA